MSQTPPPVQGYAPQPEKPKKSKKWLFILVTALVFVVIIVAASSNGSKGTSDSPASDDSASASTSDTKEASKPKAPTSLSQAQQFKRYIAKHGSAQEKEAVHHVTKVQGADNKNDILDAPEVYTDYAGDLVSADASSGKLIASAFADWEASRGQDSKNGLVTVYNKSGEMLSNGNY